MKINSGISRRLVYACSLTLAAAILTVTGACAQAAIVTRTLGISLNAANFDSYSLDVDQNGTNDFTIETAYAPDPTLAVGFDQFKFLFGSNNAVVIDSLTGDGFPAASLLTPGASVSASSLFSGPNDTGDLYFYDTIDPTTGNFAGNTGYVGFRFDGVGGTHYGFIQVSVKPLSDPSHPFDLTLGSVSYNDVAAAPATVTAIPEPASLAILLPLACYMLKRKAIQRRL